ncbi:MAG: hypothetical protein ACMG57_02645 [Candidatus Dojkabacteria bacterium]
MLKAPTLNHSLDNNSGEFKIEAEKVQEIFESTTANLLAAATFDNVQDTVTFVSEEQTSHLTSLNDVIAQSALRNQSAVLILKVLYAQIKGISFTEVDSSAFLNQEVMNTILEKFGDKFFFTDEEGDDIFVQSKEIPAVEQNPETSAISNFLVRGAKKAA